MKDQRLLGRPLSRRVVNDTKVTMQFATLERPYRFLSPFSGEEFAALIWVVDKTVSAGEQAELSRQLVEQECRYAVCAGYKCSTWDDSIDEAFIQTDPNFQPSAERFVMTTWHEGESMKEATQFFVQNTTFDNFVPKNFLVLFVGRDKNLEQQATKMVKNLLGTRAA